ncbi:MAG: O-antigen ligase family protein [Bacilli bacterium]|nr:O-antigen ligase family protein [Bacilli bacterium]
MEKVLKSKYYSLIVMAIIFVFWLLCYLQYDKVSRVASSYLITIESIELTIIGLICAFLLIKYQDLFYVVPWITYTPFVFARPFTSQTIPYALIIAGALLFIGLIIHIIRFKPKFTIGSNFAGLALLAVALVLGGINTKQTFLGEQILFTSIAAVGLIAIYVLFVSMLDVPFRTLAHLINYLGILLCLEVVCSINHSADPLSFLIYKNIGVGWGISNNIAIIMLMTFPISAYLAVKSKGPKVVLYVFTGYAQVMTIILTYSRGAIAALIIGGVATIIIGIIKSLSEERSTYLPHIISMGAFVLITSVVLMWFVNTKNENLVVYAEGFKNNISNLNLTTFNGRTDIYEHCIEEFKNNMLFGKGLYAPFFDNSFTGGYQWGHSTVIHTMYTMGLVGLLALAFHMAQKYLNLFLRPNIEKIFIAIGFLTSGLYGLVDVSYYFINYMVVLIMILVCLEKTIKESFDII